MLWSRSTKAGARTPATLDVAASAAGQDAQRRPGREPRRHSRGRPGRHGRMALNEGRGANPGDTWWGRAVGATGQRRSTKAGARTPATRPPCPCGPGARPSLTEGRGANPGDTLQRTVSTHTTPTTLNEGRGANPGDTCVSRSTARPSWRAQRRPGREPRRHSARRVVCGRDRLRSTKAGARTPATPPPTRAVRPPRRALNEGRGANPGDTPRLPGCVCAMPRRSTKAGARTPATPGPGRPGGSTWPTLNEGRGANPGDTDAGAGLRRAGLDRSTKAGARTPATRPPGRGAVLLSHRSTKAGARTPATPRCRCRGRRRRSALNEGRGANPGDTCQARPGPRAPTAAQRRPGREPRRHSRQPDPPWSPTRPLNEGRGANPGDTHRSRRLAWPSSSAQRRPGREPRRHSGTATCSRRARIAQRRPGREPRRHLDDVPKPPHADRRSTKAGARTPATRARDPGAPASTSPLNEGRGANPGDTHAAVSLGA